MSTRKRWEYANRQVGGDALFLDDDDVEMLRAMGESGWEFMQFTRYAAPWDSGWHIALFKREIADE